MNDEDVRAISLTDTQIIDIIDRLDDGPVDVKYICPQGLIHTKVMTKENDQAALMQSYLMTCISNVVIDDSEVEAQGIKVCEALVIGSNIDGLDEAIEGMKVGFDNIKEEQK